MLFRKYSLHSRAVELAFLAGMLVLVEGILWYILPEYFESNVGLARAGIAIAAYSFGGFFSDVPIGDIADKVGRKFIFVFGVILFCCSILLLLIHSFFAFTIFMFLLGLASTCIYIGSSSKVIDMSAEAVAGQSVGMYGAFRAMGWFVGSIVGGVLLYFLPFSFTLKALLGVMLFFLIWGLHRYPEEQKFKISDFFIGMKVLKKDHLYFRELTDLLKLGLLFIAFSVCNLAFGFYEYAMWMSEPIYVHSTGANVIIGGLVLALINLPALILSYHAGVFRDKFGGRLPILFGMILVALAHIYFFFSNHNLISLAITFLAIGIAQLCIFIPFEATVRRIHKRLRAEALGSFESFYELGGIIAPLIIGATSSIIEFNNVFTYTSIIFIIAFALITIVLIRESHEFQHKEETPTI